MIELGSFVTDVATKLEGMVTHYQIEMGGAAYYRFQPRALSSKSGQPVEGVWLVEERLSGGTSIPAPEFPVHILGTIVTDKASGFTGMAISLVHHINGCTHFNVQPAGLQDTGAPIQDCNFDIRRLEGAAIVPMTKEEQKVDEKKKPSPAGDGRYAPRNP